MATHVRVFMSVRGSVVATACLLAVAVIAGCGDAATSPPPSASPSAAPAATRSGLVVSGADMAAAASYERSDEQLDLPFREYELSGAYRVGDSTERVVALHKNAGAHEELWLMNLSSGRARRILAKASAGGGDFIISSIRLSDEWVAWEEIGRGDDLVDEVDWRLYAAPMRPSSLTIGAPRLVASASNREATRPLFDLSGAKLVWMSTTAGSVNAERQSLVMSSDLEGGKPRVLYKAAGALGTIGYSDEQLVVTESAAEESSGAATKTIVLLDGATGKVEDRLTVPSEFGLSHWPVWRGGWVAWAPFPSADAAFPNLYLRDAAGGVHGEGGPSVDPCIVGDYLFYATERLSRPEEGIVYELRALRLGDSTSEVLVSDDPETGLWWHGPVGAPSVDRRYVAYGDNTLQAESRQDWRTTVRVYDVP